MQKRDQESTEERDLCKTIRRSSVLLSLNANCIIFTQLKCQRYAVDRKEDINLISSQAVQIYMIILLKQQEKPVNVFGLCLWFHLIRTKWDIFTGADTSVFAPVMLDRG